MTDQEINIAIAEACGWTYVNRYGGRTKHATWAKWRVRNPEENQNSHDLPNFCDDLNAMHEADKKAQSDLMNADQWSEYGRRLMAAHPTASLSAPVEDAKDLFYEVASIASTTAAQRAEAFLRTLGKWRD